jgi:hypothetical protein
MQSVHQQRLTSLQQAIADLQRHFESSLARFEDERADVELKKWLDHGSERLAWDGDGVTSDEWFLITTLYGNRNRDEQRKLVRTCFPRFVVKANRNMRNVSREMVDSWPLHHPWQADRLCRMAEVLRDCEITMDGYAQRLRNNDLMSNPQDSLPAMRLIKREHATPKSERATGSKTLSVFVRDCVRGRCFPIDSRVEKELKRHDLPCRGEVLVQLCVELNENPRRINRMFYEAGGVQGDFSRSFA